MKKQPLLLALVLIACGYSANAQSTSTTTTRQTTVTPTTTPAPVVTPESAPTPASTTTTESTTTTTNPSTTTVVEKPVRVVPADARIKDKRNKTKIKPRD